jgi:cation-transporting P-type ATPase E
MTAALPSGAVIGIATFGCYLLAYRGGNATPVEQTQASTSALITLLIIAIWVLAVVARPYTWWRVALVAVSAGAYVVIFSIPLAQEKFLLDPSNLVLTTSAVAIGVLGAGIVEVLWWVQGAVTGNRRRVWR